MGIYVARPEAIRDLLMKHFPEAGGRGAGGESGESRGAWGGAWGRAPPTTLPPANQAPPHHPTLQANDFGSEVIPGAKDLGMRVQAYAYGGYWADIGTVDAFYEANLALTDGNPAFSFYDRDFPIYTMSRREREREKGGGRVGGWGRAAQCPCRPGPQPTTTAAHVRTINMHSLASCRRPRCGTPPSRAPSWATAASSARAPPWSTRSSACAP